MNRCLLALCSILFTTNAMAAPPDAPGDLFTVVTRDGVSIAVRHKVRAEGTVQVPVLLVHGTWGSSDMWDFPGRSVMDDLASRGYDVYALDLRGMGGSAVSGSYWGIGLHARVGDAAAVAEYILSSTGRRPVVAGLSQGGLIVGLLAASEPQLVEAVVLMGIPADGFFLPPQFEPLITALIASGADRYLPPADVVYAVAFGWDPVTGQPTIGGDALAQFLATLRPDSTRAILEMVSTDFFRDEISPAWPRIAAPALVMDGATDLLVGTARATALFEALGSAQKELVILPRNTHVWFLEDNFHSTMHEFRAFLARF